MMKTQARYKFNFDKRTRKVRDKPKVGGWIYLDPDDGTKKRPKIQHSVLGPFKVIQVDERTVMIQRDEVVERVAIDRVAPAPAPESEAPVDYPEAPTARDMQEKNIEGETWLIESLDDHRKVARGKLEFLVRWAGPYERTWKPRANISEELISRYFAKLRKNVDAKRKKASNLVVDNN